MPITYSSSSSSLRRVLPSLSVRARSKSNGIASPSAGMRNAKAKSISGAFSRSMQGMTPAWKRHCIRRRKNKTLCNNPSQNSATHKGYDNATTTASTATDTNVSLIVDQMKSFSIGSFAGLLGSLAGMGGGFVMIPMMTAARRDITHSSSRRALSWRIGGLGLRQHQAHGTSLFAVGTTGLAGAVGYGIHVSDDDGALSQNDAAVADLDSTNTTADLQPPSPGLVELDTALALATTAMVTARFGAVASSRLSEKALQKALGAFMILVAPLVPGKAYLDALRGVAIDPSNPGARMHEEDDATVNPGHGRKSRLERLLPASLIGTFSGFLSGVFGVGGGAIVVPSLVLSTDMSHHSALGTSLCAMVLPSIVGTYTHAMKGNVNWRVAPLLAFGSAVGAFVGGREVGLNLDEGVLRAGFSCLMLVLGVKTWRKGSR